MVLGFLHCCLHRPAHTHIQTGEQTRQNKHSVLEWSLFWPAHMHRPGEELRHHNTPEEEEAEEEGRRDSRAARMHRQACYSLVSYDICCDQLPNVQSLNPDVQSLNPKSCHTSA